MEARIDLVPPARGGCNTWLVGDGDEVIVVDALLADGPGQHHGEFPDSPGQLSAIGAELLTLPEDTSVLPGHGDQISIGLALPRFDGWAAGG